MKKTLMALAVGSAFVAPAAFADVTISGSINMGLNYVNNGGESDQWLANRQAGTAFTFGTISGTPVGPNQTHSGVGSLGLSSNYTNITIASMEDLGGGLKLDFAAQIDWNTTNASNSLNNRNSHIGLVGESWGGVWYGSNENIYERYFYTQDPLDGAAGLGGNLQIMGTPGGNVFQTCPTGSFSTGVSTTTGLNVPVNDSCGYTWYRRDAGAIWYDSPNWNGFTFGAVLQTNFDKQAQPEASINPYMWQVGAKYVGTSMPLQAWGAYGRRKDQFGLSSFLGTYATATSVGATPGVTSENFTSGADHSTDQAYQLGLGYTLGDVYFFGVWEGLKYSLSGVLGSPTSLGINEWKRNAYQLGLKWNLASGYVGASWMQALSAKCSSVSAACDASDTGAININLGYYHTMSKQTQLYAVGSWLDNKAQGNYGVAGYGGSAAFQNVGATIWGLSVGIKHSF
jgi:predicted porin